MYVQTSLHAKSNATVFQPHMLGSRPQPITHHRAQSMIYAQGDEVGPLYRVEFGAVRLCRLTMDGRRQISAFVLPGEVFGFDAMGEHHFYAEATTDTGVQTLGSILGTENRQELFSLALRSLTCAQEHLLVLGRQCAIERLSAFLVDMADRQDSDSRVLLPMLRNDIADYLGLTFETVSRLFGKLKDQKIIRLTNIREVEILDMQALRDMAS